MTTIVIYDKYTREVTDVIDLEESESCKIFRGIEPVYIENTDGSLKLLNNAYLINPWEGD